MHDDLTTSVIIPVNVGGDALRSSLASVFHATPPASEVIVVLDGAPEAVKDIAMAFGARVIETEAQGGPAQARNLGARHASGELLVFVDADVVIPVDTIAQIATAFQHEPGLSAVFGSYDDLPAEPNFLSQYKNLMHHYLHQKGNAEASTFWAGCGAIRRSVFLSLGGFDEGYRYPSIEDIELGYRLRRAGHRIRLNKSLQAKHLKRWTVYSLLRSDFSQRALPWSELILDGGGFIDDLNVSISSRASVVAVYGLLAALVMAWHWHPLALMAAALAALLLALNAPVYRFFARKRGLPFAAAVIPWHWFYYLYSGLAFAVALTQHWLRATVEERRQPFERQPNSPTGQKRT